MLAGVAIAGVLMAPGAASASIISTANYQGEFATDGTVGFDAKVRDGIVRRINGDPGPPATGLMFEGLPLVCDEGTTPLAVVLVSNVRVRRHRFQVRAKLVDPELDGKLRVHGRFSEDYSAVTGGVRAVGGFGGSDTNCDSGRLSWTAAAQPDAGSLKPQLLPQNLLHHLVGATADRP